jgi:hypothetical protein
MRDVLGGEDNRRVMCVSQYNLGLRGLLRYEGIFISIKREIMFVDITFH